MDFSIRNSFHIDRGMHDNHRMSSKQPQHQGKILLVDDDPGLLRLLSIRLRAEGFDVEAVESAHKALGILHRFSPDLVITDSDHVILSAIQAETIAHRLQIALSSGAEPR